MFLHLNMGKLTHNQLARLWHFRLGHPSATVPYTMRHLIFTENMKCPMILKEECPCCDQGKFRVRPFPERINYFPDADVRPWKKVYMDGHGGQTSLGTTIGGAKKGFLFVDAKSNAWKKTLVISDRQFPAVLRRFDTYSVNISDAAEEVASEFDCAIRPVSAGTPQEMGRAEGAVGELRRMIRASFAAAPHLDPTKYWGLADE